MDQVTATTEAAPPNAAGVAPSAGEEVQPVVEKTFTQKELDDIVERRLAKERKKREDVRRENEVLRKLAIERGEQQQPRPQQQQPQSGEPKREDHDSYEAFIEARAEWRANQAVEKKLAERDQRSEAEKQKATQKQQADSFRERVTTLAKEIPDFAEVMEEAIKGGNAVAQLSSADVAECERPDAVLYHLAKNPDEAERIASLPGAKQAREIWALDTKLKASPTKQPSKAPPPINPVGGKSSGADDEPDAADTVKWTAWRNRQLAAKRKGN